MIALRSIVEEALARAEQRTDAPEAPPSDIDDELKQVLEKLRTNIKIIGLGGGGSNTINRLMDEGITGAELIAGNTDAQHLLVVHSNRKILLGRRRTRGLGAGALPKVGEEAAMEAHDELAKLLEGTDIALITCGLGGGTGTGSIGVVAEAAKKAGALTIAICTLPFKGEGKARMDNAMWGLERLKGAADTVITIPNDKLIEMYPRLPLTKAFKVADEVLVRSIKGLTEIITKPGLVNLDFNDIKTIMQGAGVAMIGIGQSDANNDDRAIAALNQALNSPLLDVDMSEAQGALINVVGGADMTISEAERVAEELQSRISKSARIIWGASVDPELDHVIKIMVIATGVKSKQIMGRSATPRLAMDVVK